MIYLEAGKEDFQIEALQRCISFLHSVNFPKEGGTAELGDGIRCIVNRYTTMSTEVALWEAHKQYVDVHCVLSGEEIIRVVHTSQGKVGVYHADQDYLEVDGKDCVGVDVRMKKNSVLCLFPNDAHQVKVQVCEGKAELVTKVVFKIPIELFYSLF